MSVLRAVEGKLEGLLEGVFGRAFRANVQPVELARKLAKEMDEHRSVSVSRVYVPNEYSIYLSPGDRAQFAAYEGSLVGELQEYLGEHARREGYAMLTTPQVVLLTDEDLAVGEFGIATRIVEPEPVASRPAMTPAPTPIPVVEPPPATMIYRPAEPIADLVAAEPPPVVSERVTLELDGRVVEVTSSRVVLGRSRECDVQLDDTNASRRHCELTQDDATGWELRDLGSTNGTELNGRRVERAALADGDRITIGETRILFARTSS